jgi:hypothetical protein
VCAAFIELNGFALTDEVNIFTDIGCEYTDKQYAKLTHTHKKCYHNFGDLLLYNFIVVVIMHIMKKVKLFAITPTTGLRAVG